MSDHAAELERLAGDYAEEVRRPSSAGARLKFGVVDALVAAAGTDRAMVVIDGLPVPYDSAYAPTVNDVVWWLEDEQRRVVGGKLA